VSIVNTAPLFTTNPATLLDSVVLGKTYSVALTAQDRNNDPLSFTLITPATAVMTNNTLSLTPTADQIGTAVCCTVMVKDQWGGADTLTWAVRVVVQRMWVPQTDSLKVARMQCGVGEINGKIYVVGGSAGLSDGSKVTLNSVEAYDPSTPEWITKPPASMAKARFSPFVASWSGKLYVMGGFSKTSFSIPAIEEYDPIADTWTTLPAQLPFMRAQGAACVVGNKCYIIGGQTYDQVNQVKVNVKSIDIFDFSTKTWSKGPDLLSARADHQAVAYNGKIYVAGGSGAKTDSIAFDDNGLEMLRSIEVYDPAMNSCDSIGAIITPRSNFAAALSGDRMFLMGGIKSITTGDNYSLNGMEQFTVSTRQAASSMALPEYRHSGAGIGINNRIYCIGGVIGTGIVATSSVLIYYP
jgi:N-acetylneuraminic acid mutarotase